MQSEIGGEDDAALQLAMERLLEHLRELAQYSRLFAATPPTQRDQALTALARESAIQQMTFKTVSGRGKPRTVWVSCDLVEDENHD